MSGPVSPHFALQELATGVQVARAIDGQQALCNAAIVDLGGITVVFDAMLTPAAGGDLGKAAERLTGRRPDVLVQSHYHGDHTRGSASVAAVRVISTSRTRELLATLAHDQLTSDREQAPSDVRSLADGTHTFAPFEIDLYRGWFEGILETPADLPVVLPDVTMESRLVLHGSRRTLELLSFGGGHSGSDLWAYLPEERIALLGDLFSNGYHPWMTDGDPFEFERILGKVTEFRIDRAVPGHGDVGDHATVVLNREYVQRIIERAHVTRKEGLSPEGLTALPVPAPFDRWKFRAAYHANLAFVRERVDRAAGPTDRN